MSQSRFNCCQGILIMRASVEVSDMDWGEMGIPGSPPFLPLEIEYVNVNEILRSKEILIFRWKGRVDPEALNELDPPLVDDKECPMVMVNELEFSEFLKGAAEKVFTSI